MYAGRKKSRARCRGGLKGCGASARAIWQQWRRLGCGLPGNPGAASHGAYRFLRAGCGCSAAWAPAKARVCVVKRCSACCFEQVLGYYSRAVRCACGTRRPAPSGGTSLRTMGDSCASPESSSRDVRGALRPAAAPCWGGGRIRRALERGGRLSPSITGAPGVTGRAQQKVAASGCAAISPPRRHELGVSLLRARASSAVQTRPSTIAEDRAAQWPERQSVAFRRRVRRAGFAFSVAARAPGGAQLSFRRLPTSSPRSSRVRPSPG